MDVLPAALACAVRTCLAYSSPVLAVLNTRSLCWLSLLQAAELQRHADGTKALQEDLRTLTKASKQHEEARSKAEVSRMGL